MSVQHKYTQESSKKLHWQTLFAQGYKRICQDFERHNQRFPAGKDKPYNHGYPHRLKDSEMKTALNAYRQWCKQAAEQINAGQAYVTNEVFTNNRKLRETQDGDYGSKSVTPNHLAKLAYCGFLCGEEETDGNPHDQQIFRHRDRGGKGFGWKPYKRFRGRRNDYQLLINPNLLPGNLIALWALFAPKTTGFDARVRPMAATASPPPLLNQNLCPYSSSHTAEVNEDMSQKAAADAAGQQEEGNPQKVSACADVGCEEKSKEEGRLPKMGERGRQKQGLSARDADFSGARFQNRAPVSPDGLRKVVISPTLPGKRHQLDLQTSFRLAHDGGKVEYYARVLVEMYENKLAAAMERDYTSQHKKGYSSALKLLCAIPEDVLETFHDRMVQVIDHQEKRLRLYPDAYVVGPARFFDPAEKYNILHYEKNWLQVYEKRAIEFDERSNARLTRHKQKLTAEAELAQQEKEWYGLAWQFKVTLIRLHPKDMRLKKANLANWERDLRMMVRKEGVPLAELTAVMSWLLSGKEKNATWWRNQYSIDGIKSTSSFRQQYPKLQQAYFQDKARKSGPQVINQAEPVVNQIPKKLSGPKQIPAKKQGPKQIPTSGKIKNFRR